MSKRLFSTMVLVIAVGILGCAKKDSTSAAEAEKATAEAPAAKEAAMTPATGGGFTVLEALACRSVQDRTPIESGTTFPVSVGRVYFYTKVGVEGGGETSIQHVWYFNGNKVATVTLPARGSGWRTYSSKAIQDAHKGEWRVDITSTGGEVVKSVPFKVE